MDILAPLLVGAHAGSAIIAGHYAGLWTTLHEHPDRKWTIPELCDAADCKERWVREWVGVLASAGVLTLEEGMVVSCDSGVPAALLPSSELLHFFTSLEFTMDKEPEIGACFKKGGPLGVGYNQYPNFQDWMAGWSHCRNENQNFPEGYMKMVGGGVHEALENGIKVLEPGCGRGRHAMGVAKRYPDSSFTSFDIDEEAIELNKVEAKKLGIENIDFVTGDFCNLKPEWTNNFDYVMIFDCMHDLPHPALAMKGLKGVLKDNGIVTMLDIDTSTDMVAQTKKPITAVLYNISLHHCMSVSLSSGGVGLGACWGVELAQQMLGEAGWGEGEVRVITKDIPNHAVYVMTKGKGLEGNGLHGA